MRVVGRERLTEFYGKHADSKDALLAWLYEAEAASWKTPHDLKERYPSASVLGDGRTVFRIKGNSYRLDSIIAYKTGIVVIERVGTHAEYDRWAL
jgi:mRNA interferase HigB